MWLLLNHWFIHSNDLFKNTDTYRNETSDFMIGSLNHSLKRFDKTKNVFKKTLVLCRAKQLTLWYMIESLNHSLKRFIQKHWFIQERDFMSGLLNHDSNDLFKNTDSFRNETSNLMIGSLNQKMCIQKRKYKKKTLVLSGAKQVTLWLNHWIIHLSD